MKNTLVFICILCIHSALSAQNFYPKFKKHLQTGDTLQQRKTLEQWKAIGENDPEYYVCSFNYFFFKSQKEQISFDADPKGEHTFSVTDSSGQRAFLNSQLIYKQSLLDKALEAINTGIKKFPNRLDLRFGKIYALGMAKNYDEFTKEVIASIVYSEQIKNKWLWTLNEKKPEAEKFFHQNVFAYMTQLYNTMDDDLIPNIQQIALKHIQYYPKQLEVLSMLAVTYTLQEDYTNSVKHFLQALEINPKDHIVLSNIAQSYKRQGDKPNALKYYKLAIKHGDQQTRELAKQEMKSLKKK